MIRFPFNAWDGGIARDKGEWQVPDASTIPFSIEKKRLILVRVDALSLAVDAIDDPAAEHFVPVVENGDLPRGDRLDGGNVTQVRDVPF